MHRTMTLGWVTVRCSSSGARFFVQALEVQDQTKWLVFRMIHIKDSPLPMGKVWWAWTPWAGFFFATLQVGWVEPLWMFENRQGTDPNGPVERPPPLGQNAKVGGLEKNNTSTYWGHSPSLKLTVRT